MESYEFERNRIASLNLGNFYHLIHRKHKALYGDNGANNIRDNIEETFKSCLIQCQNNPNNPNVLLVGKVQSGKTSNLELFTALAFDNGFDLVVIYGGYDNSLLKQTTDRFKKTFDIPNEIDYSNSEPVIFSSDDSTTLLNVTDENITDFLEANKPIFLVSMKRPAAMRKINKLLKDIDRTKIKSFIIDDEGDQASLNTEKNKKESASATYAEICTMKELLSNPLYLSVTATPQANIFLDEISRLRPASVRLIEPGEGYCGANDYHLGDDFPLVDISSNPSDADAIMEGIPESLRRALCHYFIASAILYDRGIRDSDMIIHTHRTINEHAVIYTQIEQLISNYQENIKYKQFDELETLFDELDVFYNEYFKYESKIVPFEKIKPHIPYVIKRIHVILKNSTGKSTQGNESLHQYRIHIGGDLLQRGLTFKHLVTTYFLRWAKSGGNMDTNLQRARWFGYRSKYIDLCRLFTIEDIAKEFTSLAQMENDLWHQFYQVQEGSKKIDELIVLAEDTRQKATRKNVVAYSKITFKQQWNCQKLGVFDRNIVTSNNEKVNGLKSLYKWMETRNGRKNKDAVTAHYSKIPTEKFIDLIENVDGVFESEPFNIAALKENLKNYTEINLILMDKNESRKRSFYSDNTIKVLQQGADNKDKTKANYLGDSEVYINEDEVNVQIHTVVPKKQGCNNEEEILTDFEQYMFAIYIPKSVDYFVRGKNV